MVIGYGTDFFFKTLYTYIVAPGIESGSCSFKIELDK